MAIWTYEPVSKMKKKHSPKLLTLFLLSAHIISSTCVLVAFNCKPSHHIVVEEKRRMFSFPSPIFLCRSVTVNLTKDSCLMWRTPTGDTGEYGLNFFQFVIYFPLYFPISSTLGYGLIIQLLIFKYISDVFKKQSLRNGRTVGG